MSTRGSKGEKGPPGPQGETGSPGPQGEPGPGITGWQIDRQRFLAVPVLRGSHFGPPIELRPLFEEYDRQVHGGSIVTEDRAGEDKAGEFRAAPLVRVMLGTPEPAETSR